MRKYYCSYLYLCEVNIKQDLFQKRKHRGKYIAFTEKFFTETKQNITAHHGTGRTEDERLSKRSITKKEAPLLPIVDNFLTIASIMSKCNQIDTFTNLIQVGAEQHAYLKYSVYSMG